MDHPVKKSRTIKFLREPTPDYGTPEEVATRIRRVVARNPGPMTYHGTNTYLVDSGDGTTVIDPGPAQEAHVDAILRAARGPITAILVSHGHGDHIGAAGLLRTATGAPVHASPLPPVATVLTPDVVLQDGARTGDLQAIATPGHSRDHFCFFRPADGILFSGDHVLTWSSSIVSPKHGDMLDYMRSIELLIRRDDPWLLPGHGPIMRNPRSYYQSLLDLRMRREAAVIEALRSGPKSLDALVRRIYPHQTHELSILAARQNLVSHLRKLDSEGRTRQEAPDVWTIVC